MKLFQTSFPIVVIAVCCMAQEPEIPSVPLHVSTTHSLTVPGFSSWGPAQCDNHGNLFFRIGDDLNRTSILRFSPDGENHALFSLPSDFAEETAYIDFRATPQGYVQVLADHKDGGVLVFFFKHDSTSSTHMRLELPEHVRPVNFAAFPSGTILISGFYDNDAPEALRGKSFTAEYNDSGRLLTKLKYEFEPLDQAQKNKLAAVPAMDERGLLYLADGNKVLVFSETGRIERRLTITKPAKEYNIDQVRVADGKLAISFMKQVPHHPLILRIGIFDSVSGQMRGMYEPDQELGNNSVCFTGTEITFFRVKDGFVQLHEASVR